MSRILAWVGVFLITCVVSVGLLLFSTIGNTILTPFAQSLLNYSLPFSTQIHTLSIKFGSLESTLTINKTFSVKLSGAYSLRGVDMAAEIYALDSSEPLTKLDIVGSYRDYTISTKIHPDMHSPLQSPSLPPLQSTSQSAKAQDVNPQIALLAHMRFFHAKDYALRVQDLPVEIYARFLSLDIAPSGYASLLMQADSGIVQIGVKSSEFSLRNTSSGVSGLGSMPSKALGVDFYYKQDSHARQLVGRFALPSGELILRNDTQELDSVLHTSLYSPQYPSRKLASLQVEIADTLLRYELATDDMSALGEVFGFTLGGGLDLRGEIDFGDSLALHMTSESLGGLVSAHLHENLLQFSGENLSLMRILEFLRLPASFDAQVGCKGVYNLAFQKGSFEANGENLNIMLDDLARYGLEAFGANNSAQDSWGVGFEVSQADGRFALDGQLNGARFDGKLTASAQDTSIQTSRFFVDLQEQYMQIEFLEPEIKLEGKFSTFSTDSNIPSINGRTQSLQDIYNERVMEESVVNGEAIY